MKAFDRLASRFIALPFYVQFIFWLALITVVKFQNLVERPVWDSATGVFPPAIFLIDNDFNYLELFKSGDWWQGGPNVDPLALLPLLIASTMKLASSVDQVFPILHMLTFAITALAITVFADVLKRYEIRKLTVFLSCFSIAFMPVIMVQVGFIYEEILVLAMSIVAWYFWCDGKRLATLLTCAVCIAFKLTGIVIALCILISLVLNRRLWNIRNAVFLFTLFSLIVAAVFLPTLLIGASDALQRWGYESYFLHALDRLVHIPDLLVLIVTGVGVSLFMLVKYTFDLIAKKSSKCRYLLQDDVERVAITEYEKSGLLVCYLMPLVFVAGVLYQLSNEMILLPRYVIPMIPFVIATMVVYLKVIRKQHIGVFLLCAFTLVSIVNHNGNLYLGEPTSFSIVERSHEYRKYHQLQTLMLKQLEERYADIPTYLTRELWYMGSSPRMGYTKSQLTNVRPIFRDDYRDLGIGKYPAEFVLVLSNYSHGGQEILRLIREAHTSDLFVVTRTDVAVGRFSGAFLHFKKNLDT